MSSQKLSIYTAEQFPKREKQMSARFHLHAFGLLVDETAMPFTGNRTQVLRKLEFIPTPKSLRIMTLGFQVERCLKRDLRNVALTGIVGGDDAFIGARWRELMTSAKDIEDIGIPFDIGHYPEAVNCRMGLKAAMRKSGLPFETIDHPSTKYGSDDSEIMDALENGTQYDLGNLGMTAVYG